MPDVSNPRMECSATQLQKPHNLNYNYVLQQHTFITLNIQPMDTVHAHTKALIICKCFQTQPLQDLVVIKLSN
jgi:hypothetical protein